MFRELRQTRVELAFRGVQPPVPDHRLPAALLDHPGVLPAGCEAHFQDKESNSPKSREGHLHHPGYHAALLPAQPRRLPAASASTHGRDPELRRRPHHLQRQAGHHGARRPQHVPGPAALLRHHQPLQMEVL